MHGFPPYDCGGVELYAYWLAQGQAEERPTAVYTRCRGDGATTSGEVVESLDGALRVRRVNDFDQRDPLVRNAIFDRALQRDFRSFLVNVRPDLVHVHHLAGHSLGLVNVVRA